METKKQILIYTVALIPLSVAPWAMGLASLWYGLAAGGLSLIFLGHAIRVAKRRGRPGSQGDVRFFDPLSVRPVRPAGGGQGGGSGELVMTPADTRNGPAETHDAAEYDPQRAVVEERVDPASAEAKDRMRRMRQRNWALFALLWAMVALFFAITIAKMS